MPRLPRFFVPEMPLHVVQRGNGRRVTFIDADDFRFYRWCAIRAANEHDVAVHAYVLMSNHVHLLVTPRGATSVPKMMQAIGRVYVPRFNERYGRVGALWEGRYRATIVDQDGYLFACMRYIELNPVRAGIVADPGEYPWSSFRSNAYGKPDDLVRPHALLSALGEHGTRCQAAYREMFGALIPETELATIRDATQNGWALGDRAFRARVSSFGRRADRQAPGRTLGSDPRV